MDAAEIRSAGLDHLARALSGAMQYCDVPQWAKPGGAVPRVYWRALTGAEQQKIEASDNAVMRIALTVKHRARDADGRLIFADTPVESLLNDFDFVVIRAIAMIMVTDMPSDFDELVEGAEKE